MKKKTTTPTTPRTKKEDRKQKLVAILTDAHLENVTGGDAGPKPCCCQVCH